jgi:hypothetical protein
MSSRKRGQPGEDAFGKPRAITDLLPSLCREDFTPEQWAELLDMREEEGWERFWVTRGRLPELKRHVRTVQADKLEHVERSVSWLEVPGDPRWEGEELGKCGYPVRLVREAAAWLEGLRASADVSGFGPVVRGEEVKPASAGRCGADEPGEGYHEGDVRCGDCGCWVSWSWAFYDKGSYCPDCFEAAPRRQGSEYREWRWKGERNEG